MNISTIHHKLHWPCQYKAIDNVYGLLGLSSKYRQCEPLNTYLVEMVKLSSFTKLSIFAAGVFTNRLIE